MLEESTGKVTNVRTKRKGFRGVVILRLSVVCVSIVVVSICFGRRFQNLKIPSPYAGQLFCGRNYPE